MIKEQFSAEYHMVCKWTTNRQSVKGPPMSWVVHSLGFMVLKQGRRSMNTCVHAVLFCSVMLKHLELQSGNSKPPLPIIPLVTHKLSQNSWI